MVFILSAHHHYPEGLITESFPDLPDSFLVSFRMIVEFYISTGIVFWKCFPRTRRGQLFYLCIKIPFDLWETTPNLSSLSRLGLHLLTRRQLFRTLPKQIVKIPSCVSNFFVKEIIWNCETGGFLEIDSKNWIMHLDTVQWENLA